MTATPTPEPASNGLRIGDAERNAAADALQQHLTSGRLDLNEFSDRSAVVAAARTQGDLDSMFADLPPIAGAPGAAGGVATTASAQPARTASSSPAQRDGGNNRPLLIGIIGAMPFIALILFFITGLWYFFLLIPLSGAIIGPMISSGDDDDDDDSNGRNRRRNRR